MIQYEACSAVHVTLVSFTFCFFKYAMASSLEVNVLILDNTKYVPNNLFLRVMLCGGWL